uniref:Uncharacterized protein n=1 Tax=Rhizophora mucronata TaxID=61149 RepID=A0A2P2NTB1_RHIMU
MLVAPTWILFNFFFYYLILENITIYHLL